MSVVLALQLHVRPLPPAPSPPRGPLLPPWVVPQMEDGRRTEAYLLAIRSGPCMHA